MKIENGLKKKKSFECNTLLHHFEHGHIQDATAHIDGPVRRDRKESQEEQEVKKSALVVPQFDLELLDPIRKVPQGHLLSTELGQEVTNGGSDGSQKATQGKSWARLKCHDC